MSEFDGEEPRGGAVVWAVIAVLLTLAVVGAVMWR